MKLELTPLEKASLQQLLEWTTECATKEQKEQFYSTYKVLVNILKKLED